MGSSRAAKVAGALKKKISEIIQAGLRDPRIGFVTITGVKVSADLKHVKVYFTVLGSEKEKKSAQIALSRATGYIKRLIAEDVQLKFMPEIVFKFDDTHEEQQRINELLERIKREDDQRNKHSNKGAEEV